ncbi:MAG: FecR domain-containing protein [Elusimicrobia bacterium]|nr:FecR domain-containing protein [Elusimicrobiota bacterium]
MKNNFSLLLAAAMAFAMAATSRAEDGSARGSAAAVIARVSGEVLYMPQGEALLPAKEGQKLQTGDAVVVKEDANAVIVFSDGSKVQLRESSSFRVEKLQSKLIEVRLNKGVLEGWISKVKGTLFSGRVFKTRTPTAVAAVRGTEFRVRVSPQGLTTWDLFRTETPGGFAVAPLVQAKPSQPAEEGIPVALKNGERLVVEKSAGGGQIMAAPAPIPPTETPVRVEDAPAVLAPPPDNTTTKEEFQESVAAKLEPDSTTTTETKPSPLQNLTASPSSP